MARENSCRGVLFFFSSRRRHTRLQGDWSSDVCSSDLIAVDALHSDNVYLAWADRVGTGDIYTVHVRRSTDRGATWSGDLRTLTNATDASLAVSTNGTVGLLYQQVTGAGDASRWVTRLEQSRDGFATHQDVVLATVPATTPTLQ